MFLIVNACGSSLILISISLPASDLADLDTRTINGLARHVSLPHYSTTRSIKPPEQYPESLSHSTPSPHPPPSNTSPSNP